MTHDINLSNGISQVTKAINELTNKQNESEIIDIKRRAGIL